MNSYKSLWFLCFLILGLSTSLHDHESLPERLSDTDKLAIWDYQGVRLAGEWKIVDHGANTEDLPPTFAAHEGKIRGFFGLERSDSYEGFDSDEDHISGTIHEEKFNFHLNLHGQNDQSVSITAFDGRRSATKNIFTFVSDSNLYSYETIFREQTHSTYIELESDLRSFLNPKSKNKEIVLKFNITGFEGFEFSTSNPITPTFSYEFIATLKEEEFPVWKDWLVALALVSIFICKVKSITGIFSEFRMLGVWRKLSLPTQMMLTLSDLGAVVYFLNEVCDYERTSFLIGIISVFIPPLIVILDLILLVNMIEMKWNHYFPPRREEIQANQNPRRANQVKSFKGFLKTVIVLLVAFHVGKFVIVNYFGSDPLKYFLSFAMVPQILDNAFFQFLPYERIGLFFGNFSPMLIIFLQKGVSENPCYIAPDYNFCLKYGIILGIQVLILIAQIKFEYLVATSFLQFRLKRGRYLVELEPDQAEQDCSICMGALGETPLLSAESKPGIERLIREMRPKKGQIMKTPCDHRFHVICLTQWLSNKLECPMCREKLEFVL